MCFFFQPKNPIQESPKHTLIPHSGRELKYELIQKKTYFERKEFIAGDLILGGI